MSKNVVTIEADEPMQRAAAVMKGQNVRMLPLASDGRLVGIVSDTDLKRASESLAIARVRVGSPVLEWYSWYA